MKKLKFYFFIINSLIAITPFLSIYSAKPLFILKMTEAERTYLLNLEDRITRLRTHPYAYYEFIKRYKWSVGIWLLYNNLDPTECMKNLIFMLEGYIRMLSAHKDIPAVDECIDEIKVRIETHNIIVNLISDQRQEGLVFKDDENKMSDEFFRQLKRMIKLSKTYDITEKAHGILEESYYAYHDEPLSHQELFEAAEFKIVSNAVDQYIGELIRAANAGLIRISKSVYTAQNKHLDTLVNEYLKLTIRKNYIHTIVPNNEGKDPFDLIFKKSKYLRNSKSVIRQVIHE